MDMLQKILYLSLEIPRTMRHTHMDLHVAQICKHISTHNSIEELLQPIDRGKWFSPKCSPSAVSEVSGPRRSLEGKTDPLLNGLKVEHLAGRLMGVHWKLLQRLKNSNQLTNKTNGGKGHRCTHRAEGGR